jgi:3-deoxy-D-manno-octulosonate 8-phosphate phosphatase KdsC-like HAD superfamily phosphatase
MAKNYFYLILVLFLFGISAQAQQGRVSVNEVDDAVSIYPNPNSDGKLYIKSNGNLIKEVEIFDILGKSMIKSSVSADKVIAISNLSSGVYLVNLKTSDAVITRKLVVR